MEELVSKVLNCLYARYPFYSQLEETRQCGNIDNADFVRAIFYLEEKCFIAVDDKQISTTGIYGKAKITAAGIDWLNDRSRRIKARVLG